MKSFIFLFLVL